MDQSPPRGRRFGGLTTPARCFSLEKAFTREASHFPLPWPACGWAPLLYVLLLIFNPHRSRFFWSLMRHNSCRVVQIKTECFAEILKIANDHYMIRPAAFLKHRLIAAAKQGWTTCHLITLKVEEAANLPAGPQALGKKACPPSSSTVLQVSVDR
jgi:hypothetical protein